MSIFSIVKKVTLFFILTSSVVFAQDKEPVSYYLGLGVSSISGNSAETNYDSINTGIITLGAQVHSMFALELSSIINKGSNNGNKLKYFRSAAVLANYPINDKFALLGKLGLSALEISNQSGILKAESNTTYGVGTRYQYSSETFIDTLFEKILDRTIDGRQQDFDQTSIVIKQKF